MDIIRKVALNTLNFNEIDNQSLRLLQLSYWKLSHKGSLEEKLKRIWCSSFCLIKLRNTTMEIIELTKEIRLHYLKAYDHPFLQGNFAKPLYFL